MHITAHQDRLHVIRLFTYAQNTISLHKAFRRQKHFNCIYLYCLEKDTFYGYCCIKMLMIPHVGNQRTYFVAQHCKVLLYNSVRKWQCLIHAYMIIPPNISSTLKSNMSYHVNVAINHNDTVKRSDGYIR